ncbi:hypothetical protein K2173_015541 [Erythroxylum novogranatense]|uniref:MADS-box domain-containing protein n=1 Tax=Erythroxylum novogranatense TaxID=1862640 RepID=A0AAV8SSP5_9ROSI|nr:hypothetical protein K2173_015541 [Erythroxylum novogranatense]
MTRKKVKLAYITNDSARKATFKKRKKGLMKKVSELSTLCDVKACAIIYSPYDSQPEVWPSTFGVQEVVSLFNQMPEMEQSKKMVNQDSFLRQRIAKANEQLKKQRKDNREKEVNQVMFQSLGAGKISLQHLNLMDLNDLGWVIDQKLEEIHKKLDDILNNKDKKGIKTNNSQAITRPSSSASASVEHAQQQIGQMPSFDVNMEKMQRQQWFIDMMNPEEHMGFGGDDMMMPFGDNHHNALWSNGFFPLNWNF